MHPFGRRFCDQLRAHEQNVAVGVCGQRLRRGRAERAGSVDVLLPGLVGEPVGASPEAVWGRTRRAG